MMLRAFILLLCCFCVKINIAQNKAGKLTYLVEWGETEWIKFERSDSAGQELSIHIANENIYIDHSIWLCDTVEETWSYRLEPHVDDSILENDPYLKWHSGVINFWDDSSQSNVKVYQMGFSVHPCQALASIKHNDTVLTSAKYLACRFDTVRRSHSLTYYNSNQQLLLVFTYKDDTLKQSEKRVYDDNGNCIEEYTRCDTFLYHYDSIGRIDHRRYNYGCDDFRYELFYSFNEVMDTVIGIKDGIARLSSTTEHLANGQTIITHYFFDSTIEKNTYLNDTLQKEIKLKNDQVIELYEYRHYIEGNKNFLFTYRNGELYRRKISISEFILEVD